MIWQKCRYGNTFDFVWLQFYAKTSPIPSIVDNISYSDLHAWGMSQNLVQAYENNREHPPLSNREIGSYPNSILTDFGLVRFGKQWYDDRWFCLNSKRRSKKYSHSTREHATINKCLSYSDGSLEGIEVQRLIFVQRLFDDYFHSRQSITGTNLYMQGIVMAIEK